MRTLIRRTDPFVGFGDSLIPSAARLAAETVAIPDDRLDARAMLRANCPAQPGVYGMLDESNQLVYVGKSKLLRNRLLSYFAKTPSDDKMLRIIRQAKRIVWEPISHELLALVREQELISRWTPTYNRQGQPLQRRPVFLCISNGIAPHVFSTSRPSLRAGDCFGPIRGSGQASEAAVSLNYAFRLRDCPDRTRFDFDEQLSLFPVLQTAQCLRHELGSCLGPCAGDCTKSQYRGQIQQARAFLQGEDLSVIAETRQAMDRSAADRIYERASILRNRLDALAWLARRLQDLREARSDVHGIYPVTSFTSQPIWVLLSNSFLAGMVVAPHDARSWLQIADQVDEARKRVVVDSTDVHSVLLQLIMVSWFRTRKAARPEIVSYDDALQKLRAEMLPGARIPMQARRRISVKAGFRNRSAG
jgi:excinuclease ABC subunit C